MSLLVTHCLYGTCTVSEIQLKNIKIPSQKRRKKFQQSVWNWTAHKRIFWCHSMLWNRAFMLGCAECWFLGQAHTKRLKIENLSLRVIFGSCTSYLSLCLTVIRSAKNTRPQWFMWANYTVYHTGASLPPGQTVPVFPSVCFPSSLKVSSHTHTHIYSFFHSAGLLTNPILISDFAGAAQWCVGSLQVLRTPPIVQKHENRGLG